MEITPFNLPCKFKREKSNALLYGINKAFLDYFKSLGYSEVTSVDVSSGIDPTVRFIGSHTSVVKPYIEHNTVPREGLCISQSCLKTTNLKVFRDPEAILSKGSLFTMNGILANFDMLGNVFNGIIGSLTQGLEIPLSDLEIDLSSDHLELKNNIPDTFPADQVTLNKLASEKYLHGYGANNLHGRVARIMMLHPQLDSRSNIATVIVLYKNNTPLFVEAAISPIMLLKHYYNLDHVLDCFPVPQIKGGTNNIVRKVEDMIIVAMKLYSEGLYPATRRVHNRNELLKKYIKSLAEYSSNLNITLEEIESLLQAYELACLGDSNGYANKITTDLSKHRP